ncbi:MAG: hypothetical protein JF628_11085 [Sphingomonas sp.]|nr:hypothetical protein [Sphingomonas sp.]
MTHAPAIDPAARPLYWLVAALPIMLGHLYHAASVPIGGHYLPDILGGIIVAMLGIAAKHRWG